MANKWLNNILGKDEQAGEKKDDATAIAPVIQAKLEEKSSEATSVKKAVVAKKHPIANGVLVRPVYTEKALIASGQRKYVFEVAESATKLSVKKAFFNLFGMMPAAVNMVRQQGKVVRYGRVTGKRNDTKKAIITLKKGESIQ